MNARNRVLWMAALLACVAVSWAQPRDGRHSGDMRMRDTLRAGDAAPDFKLKTKDGSREVQLSGFKGKRPVVLVFGSYT